jgi:phosphinothricin acetyltransferase
MPTGADGEERDTRAFRAKFVTVPPQFSIRDARVEDLAAIFDIYNHEVRLGTATFDTEPWAVGRDDGWLTGRDRSCHPVIVAVEGERVIGWASLNPWSPKKAYARTAEGSVYVEPGARGSGVGSALLSALVERARAAELGVIVARIAEANESSVRLCERVGFERIGTQRRCGEKFGRILDVELMDLQLDGG